jgi:hypothetical protein
MTEATLNHPLPSLESVGHYRPDPFSPLRIQCADKQCLQFLGEGGGCETGEEGGGGRKTLAEVRFNSDYLPPLNFFLPGLLEFKPGNLFYHVKQYILKEI